ncbi:MAG: hypothetical protein M5U12_22180 [Verrucomicrobia bacterium]|nr:hypothetical protein [Verrucomicrobiota bacterium]
MSSLAYARPDGTTAASVTRQGRVTSLGRPPPGCAGGCRWSRRGEEVALREAATGVDQNADVTGLPRLFFDSGGRRLIDAGTSHRLVAGDGLGGGVGVPGTGPPHALGALGRARRRERRDPGHWRRTRAVCGRRTGPEAGHDPHRSGAFQRQVAFSPDSRYFTPAAMPGTARVYALPGGEEVRVLTGHVFGGRFSPDGGRLAVYGSRRFVSVLNLERANQDLTLRGHLMTVGLAAFSSDGRRLATADWDGGVKVWSALPGRSVWPVGLWPKATAASADGRWALGCISYGDLQVWDTASGTLARAIPARWSQPYLADFSPNNRWVTTSTDPIGRVWDVSTGQLVGALLGGSNVMFVARFSPDGRWIASVAPGGVVSRWGVPSFHRRWSVARAAFLLRARLQPVLRSPRADGWVRVSRCCWICRRVARPGCRSRPRASGRSLSAPTVAGSRSPAPTGSCACSTPPPGGWSRAAGVRDGHPLSGFSSDGRRTIVATTDSNIANFEAGLLQLSGRRERARTAGPGRPLGLFRHGTVCRSRQSPAPGPPTGRGPCASGKPPWRDRDYAHLPGATAARIRALRHGLLARASSANRRLRFRPGPGIWLRQPVRVEGIAVGQRVRRLHVLQATCPAEAVSDGTTIGSYVWHYADGTRHEEPIVYGRDLRYWWLPAGEAPQDLERGRIAWVGDTPLAQKAGARMRLVPHHV